MILLLHVHTVIIMLHCVTKKKILIYSGAPWVTKFGKLSIRENLVMT